MKEEGKFMNGSAGTENLIMSSNASCNRSLTNGMEGTKRLRFSGIKFIFEGQPVQIKGELPYHKFMDNEKPNWELVQEVASELGSWVDEQFQGEPEEEAKGGLTSSFSSSSLRDCAIFAYYCVFKVMEDENSPKFKKLMTAYARFCLITWVWDDIMERTKGSNLTLMTEKQRKFTEIVTKALRNVGLMKYVSKHRFKMEYRRSQFGKEYPQYSIHAYMVVLFNRYMVEEHQCDQGRIHKMFFKWMDTMATNPGWKSDLPVGSDLQPRFNTDAAYALLCFAAMLANVKRGEEVEKDDLVHQLELLYSELGVFINDLFSLEREYVEKDPNNFVLTACFEGGMDFETALQNFLDDRKSLFNDFENLYRHIRATYCHKDQQNLVEYADIVWKHCAGIWSAHVWMSRYSNFDLSIV